MRKFFIILLAVSMMFVFASCGSEEPTAYSPSDIQYDDGVYSVIYDIDNSDTNQWSGYDTKETEVQTAVGGIKACMARDDWSDDAVVFGYAKEPKLSNMMYSYGMDGDYSGIAMYQLGIYNDTYTLQDELK